MSDPVKVDVTDPANTALGNAYLSSPFVIAAATIVSSMIALFADKIPQNSIWAVLVAMASAAVAYITQRGLQKNAAIKGAASIAANAALGAAVSAGGSFLPGGASGAERAITIASNPTLAP